MTQQSAFTRRELEIIALLTQGKANKQIALELSISQRTVEFHITHILKKLNVSSRTEAVIKLAEGSLRKTAGQPDETLRKSPVSFPEQSSENDQKSSVHWRNPMRKYLFISAVLFVLIALIATPLLITALKKPAIIPSETPLQLAENQLHTPTPRPDIAEQIIMTATVVASPETIPPSAETKTLTTPADTGSLAFFEGWPTVISPVFPDEDIYPAPLPLQFGAWPATAGCPNPDSLEDYAGLLPEVAVDVLQRMSVGTREAEMQWTDPAYWPVLINPFKDQQITQDWINEIARVSDSPYAQLVTAQCGEETMKLSWWVQVCPGPCQTNGASQSLMTNVFMIARMQWLVWAIQ
jgi:DNA-binding CsgD family transcriptional regulator